MKQILLLLLLFHYMIAACQEKSTEEHLRSVFFSPANYCNAYNAKTPPALRIRTGDTVHTRSLDALGFDKDSVKRGERGNPLTGPFYIEGAFAGDAIAITIVDLSLNRNFATTLNAFIPKILPNPQARLLWRKAKLVRWNLDLINKTATPANNYEHLSGLSIPLDPFLGSVGVAPPGTKSISSGGFGVWGGNLDFNAIKKSATLYLPVYHEGAFLYLGDGHAAQGDGELNGDALETSLDFAFTVTIVKNAGPRLTYPRVEDRDYTMAFGQAKNLDLALKEATLNLMNWLQQEYNLSVEEATQLIGPAVEYRIPKIASDTVEVVAMIKKNILDKLKKGL
mgnify:CR=1 FL=1